MWNDWGEMLRLIKTTTYKWGRKETDNHTCIPIHEYHILKLEEMWKNWGEIFEFVRIIVLVLNFTSRCDKIIISCCCPYKHRSVCNLKPDKLSTSFKKSLSLSNSFAHQFILKGLKSILKCYPFILNLQYQPTFKNLKHLSLNINYLNDVVPVTHYSALHLECIEGQHRLPLKLLAALIWRIKAFFLVGSPYSQCNKHPSVGYTQLCYRDFAYKLIYPCVPY